MLYPLSYGGLSVEIRRTSRESLTTAAQGFYLQPVRHCEQLQVD